MRRQDAAAGVLPAFADLGGMVRELWGQGDPKMTRR